MKINNVARCWKFRADAERRRMYPERYKMDKPYTRDANGNIVFPKAAPPMRSMRWSM